MKLKTLRWGIIGAANIAKQQVIPAIIQTPNNEVTAIASSSGKAESLAQQFHIPNTFQSYEALLESSDVDAVYIALPNADHKQWALAAIQANKHVLCEKPIVLTTKDLIELQQAAKKHHVLLMEAFMYRFHPQIGKAKQLITEGTIGEILTIRARFHFTMENWDDDIRLDPNLGGGVLNDIGCYPVNVLNYLIEETPKNIQALQGRAKKGIDTHIAVQLSYPSGILAQFDASFYGPMTQTIDIIGTTGTMQLPFAFRADQNNYDGIIHYHSNNETHTVKETGNAYIEQIKAFHQAIENKESPTYTHAQMLQQTETLERIAKAL
ncbi:Predicted dehydrogenase [Paenisporosarcina quisquiliarum]|nr:Predicted dehydrogenase [Paenisporosarcina quisquiliarum]